MCFFVTDVVPFGTACLPCFVSFRSSYLSPSISLLPVIFFACTCKLLSAILPRVKFSLIFTFSPLFTSVPSLCLSLTFFLCHTAIFCTSTVFVCLLWIFESLFLSLSLCTSLFSVQLSASAISVPLSVSMGRPVGGTPFLSMAISTFRIPCCYLSRFLWLYRSMYLFLNVSNARAPILSPSAFVYSFIFLPLSLWLQLWLSFFCLRVSCSLYVFFCVVPSPWLPLYFSGFQSNLLFLSPPLFVGTFLFVFIYVSLALSASVLPSFLSQSLYVCIWVYVCPSVYLYLSCSV